MNFDPLFEDLEARFSANEASVEEGFSVADLERVTSIALVLHNSIRQMLIAPVLGHGFVSGVDPDSPNWVGLPMEAIRSLVFNVDPTPGLPTMQFSEGQFLEHIQQLPLPAKCDFRTKNSDDGLVSATLLDADFGLLFLQFQYGQIMTSVPLVQLTQLRIWAVDNSSTDS